MTRRQEKEQQYQDYYIKYEIAGEQAIITGVGGLAIQVCIPEQIEEKPVTEIDRKAFLSQKRLRRVTLPQNIHTIGDWAFAYCDNLEEITLAHKNIQYGKAIFLQCRKLKKILFADEQGQTNEDIGVLMAMALTDLDAYYLFDPVQAGSREWISKWDFRLRTLMETDDMEGYSQTVLCGEEDYGSRDNNVAYFLSQKRRTKVRMAAVRLLHPYGLTEDFRTELVQYLKNHRKGQPEQETWEVVKEEHPDERIYYELLGECECITAENVDGMLRDLGDAHAEMKAFLLKYKNSKMEKTDYFDCFSLE